MNVKTMLRPYPSSATPG